MKRSTFLLLFLAAIIVCSPAAYPQTIFNAATCSQGDVQAALTAAGASTATTIIVNIPAGTCNWTTKVSFSVNGSNTSMSILGAGNLTTVGGGDVTIIQDNDVTDSDKLFNVFGNNNTAAL